MIAFKNLKIKERKPIFCSKEEVRKARVSLEKKTHQKFKEFARGKREAFEIGRGLEI